MIEGDDDKKEIRECEARGGLWGVAEEGKEEKGK